VLGLQTRTELLSATSTNPTQGFTWWCGYKLPRCRLKTGRQPVHKAATLHAQQPLCEPGRWQPHNHLSFSWCCGSGSHTCLAAGASPHLPPTQPLVPHHTLSLSNIFPWSLSSCIAERQSLSLSEKASISHREE